MQIFKEIATLTAFLKNKKILQQTIGLVPTMGALHNGHLALVAESRKENDVTVCSIYVNPTQFNNASDLEKYPRMPDRDISMLEEAGCDVLFMPETAEMYASPSSLKFDFGNLDKVLEGEFRPGHFSGVALVVSKLFNIVQPDSTYFGQKDFQQASVIARLIEELRFQIRLVVVPTLREPDGLAMSSRNIRLNPDQRLRAVIFFHALQQAKLRLNAGNNLTEVKKGLSKLFEGQKNVRLEYFEVADKKNLIVLEDVIEPGESVMLIAGFVGDVRLIDNMLLKE